MNTIMNDDHLKTLAQVRAFLDGTQDVEFSLAKAATPTSHQTAQKPRHPHLTQKPRHPHLIK